MFALKSALVAGFAMLLILTGCGDSVQAAGGGGSAADGGAGGTAASGGTAGTAGVGGTGGAAGTAGEELDTPRKAFLAYCEKLAYCQPPPIPNIYEPLDPEVFFEQCAASFGTMARTNPCLEALALFWACAAGEEGCDPLACDVHLPQVDEACRPANGSGDK